MRVKIYKNIIVALCIMVLCVNNFAAVVSDNDGSAFITKAEFDSLKNNFQSQLDQYNSNIDNKIDAAIASYLSGLNISVSRTFDVINKNWNQVTFINGVFDNDYKVPDIYYLLAAGGYFQSDITAGGVRDWSSHAFFYYKRAANTANRKNCFNVLSGSEGSPTKIQWKGIARGYRESILYALENNKKYSSLSGWNWPTWSKRVMIKNGLKAKGASYAINENSVITDLTLECQARDTTYSTSTWQVQPVDSTIFNKAVTDLSIATDTVDGKEYDTEHIVGWDKDTAWELYCTDWNHSWQLSSKQTLTDTDIYNATTINTSGWYEGLERVGDTTVRSHVGSMPFNFENGSSKFYSVGLYATAVKNSQIYQMEEDLSYKTKKTFIVENSTLEKGLPILAASKDDEVTYTPVITSVECYDESGNWKTNSNEAELCFSYGPFNEKFDTNDCVQLEGETLGTTYTSWITENRKAKVKFKMKKDSVVYMQIKPSFSSGATYGPSHKWVITYDLTGDSGSYKVKSE